MSWALTLWAKLKGWAIGLAALLLAVAAAWLLGRREGRVVATAAAGKQQAENNAAAAQAQVTHAEVRHDVEVETAKLPDAPAQRVADADPTTAAGHLRDDGWMR